jgi:ferredoxin
LSQHPDWKRISKQKEPMPGHEKWAQVKDKLPLLLIDDKIT